MGGSVLTGSHPNNPSLPREVAPQMPHRRPQPPRIEHGGGAAALVHAVEALGVLYGDVQLLSQLLEGLVGREVQAVEACVGSGQFVTCAPLFDGEQLWAVGAVEFGKAVHGHSGGPRHKLQQADTLLRIHQEHRLPEPEDDGVVGAVAVLVLGVLSPVVHIHISQTTHQQLEKTEQTRITDG